MNDFDDAFDIFVKLNKLHKIKIKDTIISVDKLYKLISCKLQLDIKSFYLKFDNVILKKGYLCKENFSHNNIIVLHLRVKGGIGLDDADPLKPIKDAISEMEKPLNAMAEFAKGFLKILVKAAMLLVWFFQFSLWFALDFLNPITLSKDLVGGVNRITRLVVIGFFDIIFGILKYGVNNIIGPVFSGNLMGWDQDTYKKKDSFKNTKNNKRDKNKFNNTQEEEESLKNKNCQGTGKKCYTTPSGQLPFSIIIATVLCPPIGILMQFGLSYWINIILCGLLTLVFYFPGLIYALILLYC